MELLNLEVPIIDLIKNNEFDLFQIQSKNKQHLKDTDTIQTLCSKLKAIDNKAADNAAQIHNMVEDQIGSLDSKLQSATSLSLVQLSPDVSEFF